MAPDQEEIASVQGQIVLCSVTDGSISGKEGSSSGIDSLSSTTDDSISGADGSSPGRIATRTTRSLVRRMNALCSMAQNSDLRNTGL